MSLLLLVKYVCLYVCSTFLLVLILDRCGSHNLVMKHIPGADPELVLLNHYYEELDVSLIKLSVPCHMFLVE